MSFPFIFICCSFLCNLVFSNLVQASTSWGYDADDGPSKWCNILTNTECCGPLQSPINIVPKTAVRINSDVILTNYATIPTTTTMDNNGHTVVVEPKYATKTPQLSFNGQIYSLDSYHFHWGKNDSTGSEHSINDQKFPLELHFVHVNVKYGSATEAANQDGGLAVLAILFKISKADNKNYNDLINTLPKVINETDLAVVSQNFPLSSLLPLPLNTSYLYNGSLTTPPCSESVNWFILTNTNFISQRQIQQFRQLRTEYYVSPTDIQTEELADNYRDVTFPLNGRELDICRVKLN